MQKVLKPFVVLSTYVVLYAVTYSLISAIVSVLFWINYLDVVQSGAMKTILVLFAVAHSIYALVQECEK